MLVCQDVEHQERPSFIQISFSVSFSLLLFLWYSRWEFGRQLGLVSHVDLLTGVLHSFSTFNGSLKLAFSENKSKQVSFVFGLIDLVQ